MIKFIAAWLLVINVVSFAMFGMDKWKAKHKKYRIPESTLLLLAVLGGSVGAVCGMDFFRHKTLHKNSGWDCPLSWLSRSCLRRDGCGTADDTEMKGKFSGQRQGTS